MGFTKIVRYGDTLEIYKYEKHAINNRRKKSTTEINDRMSKLSLHREDMQQPEKQEKTRRQSNARHAVLGFKRLVLANLEQFNNPILASLTYAENITDIRQGHKDFHAFARAIRLKFGGSVRYISVAEFQKRGAIHFHTLFWGLPPGLVETERSTRLVAKLWGKGFTDLIQTDGDERISSYLSKYMAKMFTDPRLSGKRAYIASRNVLRPLEDKRAIVIQHFYENELSTRTPLREGNYETQWLGACRFRHYSLKA